MEKGKMSQETEWVELTTVAYGYQSEMIIQALRDAGIPALTRAEVGVFGFGFGGPVPKGITISVPSDRLEEAQSTLEANPFP